MFKQNIQVRYAEYADEMQTRNNDESKENGKTTEY